MKLVFDESGFDELVFYQIGCCSAGFFFSLDTRMSSRRRHQHQEGADSEEVRRCWNEASLCFNTTTTLQVCRIGVLLTMDPTLHHKMTVTSR